jgi:arylsulfatase A-like enzyme
MNKHAYIKIAGFGVGLALAPSGLQAATPEAKRPNIIYIFTDQQSATMMSCAGNQWLKTPAMDSMAANGIRFERAYTPNPVCSPARVSLMTGRFPGDFHDAKGNPVRENGGSMRITDVSDSVKNTTLAAFMQKADYELAYGGKEHLPKELTPTALGFNDLTNNERNGLAKTCSDYIRAKHDKPYFLIASFINPHDICYMALKGRFSFKNRTAKPGVKYKNEEKVLIEAMKLPEGVSEAEFFATYCPPLPANFDPQKGEPRAINALLRGRSFRQAARENYTEKDWRLHRWAYCRLTERVDSQIQQLLDAVKESGQEENTLIIFSSDHGDMDSSHRMEHKTALYEQSANIPFIAMWKGHIPAGQVDKTHLVSNGLDLLPTVCDYAGVKGVSDPRGRSLRPLFEGKSVEWRETLGVESEIGRMVVSSDRFKYIKYDFAGIEEQLLDLNRDPFETKHFTDNPEYAPKLKELRNAFKSEWFPGY